MTHLHLAPRFRLESGRTLRNVRVAFKTWGRLSSEGDNAVLVCHALTGDTSADVWWEHLVGPGRVIDTDRYFVVCINTPGSPYGSTSPITIDPSTGLRYGPSFPLFTIRDTVALHRTVLEKLGVNSVEFAIGGSMGGMQVLEWAFHDKLVKRLIPIAVGARHSAWCIGWSHTQRQCIAGDPRWHDGWYSPEEPPIDGLAAARSVAMLSYRASGEFESRFARDAADSADYEYAVESYLSYQGSKLVDRFDANCYVTLTRQMDTHDVTRGRGSEATVLRQLHQPTLVVGITTDLLYPLREQRELARQIPDAQLAILDAPYGHDSFLVAQEQLGHLVQRWLHPTNTVRKPIAV